MQVGKKRISVSHDKFNLQDMNKKKGSNRFSENIRKPLNKPDDMMKFFGIWKDMPEEEFNGIKKTVETLKKPRKRDYL